LSESGDDPAKSILDRGVILRDNSFMYYVYALENQGDKSLYIGFTKNLKQRISEHQNGQGGRTTKNKLLHNLFRGIATKDVWKLIYFEGYLLKTDALGREKFLKGGSGRKYLNKQLSHYFKSECDTM